MQQKKICINQLEIRENFQFWNHFFLLCPYADDLVLMSQSPVGLQHCLNALQNFCKDWKLDINPNKTKVIVFCKKDIPDNTFGFYYSHNIIEITDKYKYLGDSV